MLGVLGRLFCAVVTLLLWLLRLVWLPFRVYLRFHLWLEEAITHAERRFQEQRKRIQERAPLSDEAFLERSGAPTEDAPVWLATREAVAVCCALPPASLYPDDALTTLEWMMQPGADAHWADLGCNWLDVVLRLGEALGVSISLDDLDKRWQQDGLRDLRQFTALVADMVREHGHIFR
jgi:hypothetical protein